MAIQKDYTLIHIATHAADIFRSLRWAAGPVCPHCGSHVHYNLADGRYKCRACHHTYSDTSDTIFHGSKISISYWMITLYLMLSGKGISSYELARKLQVTQKTAYYMLMRIRTALDQDDLFIDSPVVAHDEVYIGGDYKNFSLAKRQKMIKMFNLPKSVVTVKQKMSLGNAVNARTKKGCFGITDGHTVILKQVPTPISAEEIVPVYRKHVSSGGLAVADCSILYKDWERLTGRVLHTNNHSKSQFVADNGTSSNMIENVFSWLERTNIFVQVHYSRAYTQLYLNEFAFRFNHRHMSVRERLEHAIKKCQQRFDRRLLRRLNDEEHKLYREDKFFNPVKFFENHILVEETEVAGLIYRRSEFCPV